MSLHQFRCRVGVTLSVCASLVLALSVAQCVAEETTGADSSPSAVSKPDNATPPQAEPSDVSAPEKTATIETKPASAVAKLSERVVKVEVFKKSECGQCDALDRFLAQLNEQRADLDVQVVMVDQDAVGLKRLHELTRRVGISNAGLPTVRIGERLIIGFGDEKQGAREIQNTLGIEIFGQDGCPHCVAAKKHLEAYAKGVPGLKVTYTNISREPGAYQRMMSLARQHHIDSPQVPMISVFGNVQIGFERADTTGQQIKTLVDKHYSLREAVIANAKADTNPARTK